MREKPILFNTEMTRMILDGRKTQTRRIMKRQPGEGNIEYNPYYNLLLIKNIPSWSAPINEGDILWVRETWAVWSRTYGTMPKIIYKADENPRNDISEIEWRPSIHMPREIARIFLIVTRVRAERLQDISGADCVAEGCDAEMLSEVGVEFTKGVFHGIWDSTVKKKDLARYGWDANPLVWVYDFRRIEHEAAR